MRAKKVIYWTPEEDAELKRLYIDERKGVKEVGKLMGRKVLGVKSRLNLLGIRHKDQSPPWSTEEDRILRECFDKSMSSTTISKIIKRTSKAISYRRRELELHSREAGERWTPEQDTTLQELVRNKISVREIAEHFGKKRAAINARMGRLDIRLSEERPKQWTPDEDALLTKLFNEGRSRKEMAEILRIRHAQLSNRLARLNLRTKQNPSLLSRYSEEQIQKVIDMYVGGVRTKEIVEQSSVPEATVYYIINSRNIPKRRQPMRKDAWTDEEKTQMVALLNAGKSINEIAIELDRGISGVVSACRKLGLRGQYQALKDERNEEKRHMIENLDGRLRYILGVTERRAVKLDMDFELTFDNLKTLYEKQKGRCYYSGIPLSVITHDPYLMSVDRVDSLKGYTEDNVVFAAWHVNFMKQDLNETQFLDLCRKITEHQSNCPRKAESDG
jgi:predicted DNA-binding protein YlxM (UPF0122 family)